MTWAALLMRPWVLGLADADLFGSKAWSLLVLLLPVTRYSKREGGLGIS